MSTENMQVEMKLRYLNVQNAAACQVWLVLSSVARLAIFHRVIVNFSNETTVGHQKWRCVATVTSNRHLRWPSMPKSYLIPQLQPAALISIRQSCLASGRTDLRRRQICSTCNKELSLDCDEDRHFSFSYC